tara:strand:+ start:1372 stop:1725 length:354 start_codon:yes stop_codon:yes gene_type:complete
VKVGFFTILGTSVCVTVVVVVVVTVGVVCVVVSDPSSFVTVDEVVVPVVEEDEEPEVIVFESTPPALEYWGNTNKDTSNTKKNTDTIDPSESFWFLFFFCIIVWLSIVWIISIFFIL